MKLRDDVFPNYCSLFESKEQYIKKNLAIAHKAFESVFSSTSEVAELFNQIKDAKKAELFLQLARYYNISKYYAKHDFLKVVMMISLIERLAAQEEEYLDFKDWIVRKGIIEKNLGDKKSLDSKLIRKFIEKKREEYHKKYGSVRNFAAFLGKYLDLDDQIKFIRSIKPERSQYLIHYSESIFGSQSYKNAKEVAATGKFKLEEGLVPVCYSWRNCWMEGADCRIWKKEACSIYQSADERQQKLRMIAGIFYGMRSKFVHEAKVLPISETQEIQIGLLAKYDNKPILVDLTIDFLETMFEKMFKKFFEERAK